LLVFSEVTDEEFPRVIDLWARCDTSNAKINVADQVAAARKPPSASILIGEKAGDVICCAMVGFVGQRGWINDICVDKALQRRGFGTAIVSAAEKWLQERDAPNIRLKVRHTNLSVIRFYDKLGCHFQDTVVLRKHLDARVGAQQC